MTTAKVPELDSPDQLSRQGRTISIELWYPRLDERQHATHIEVGLTDVRAADTIKIHYDFDRDGYVIEQASKFDDVDDMDWQEVAFVGAWDRDPTKRVPDHVDDYIDGFEAGDAYSQFVLNLFRLPAIKRMRWAKWIEQHKLFCDHEGKRWRVTGASRLGDVWLVTDFARDTGYEKRVQVGTCSNWGAEP